jgi:hypothetical protein
VNPIQGEGIGDAAAGISTGPARGHASAHTLQPDLETALTEWSQLVRLKVAAWSATVLAELLARAREAVSRELAAILAAEANRTRMSDPEAFEEHLRGRVQVALQRGREAASQAIGVEAESLALGLGDELGPALADRLEPVDGLRARAGSALRQNPWPWRPPAWVRFRSADGPSGYPPPDASILRLWLPGRWGRRRTVERMRQGIGVTLAVFVADLEGQARSYWEACLASLEEAARLRVRHLLLELGRDWPLGSAGAPGPSGPFEGMAAKCIVCADAWQALDAFFCHFQRAMGEDPVVQDAFREAPGLCAGHLWQLERFSSPRGLCGGLPEVVNLVIARLVGIAQQPEGASIESPLLAHAGTCQACRVLEQATRASVDRLVRALQALDGAAGSGRPPDLCLQHLPRVLGAVSAANGAALARHVAARLEGVAVAMTGFVVKTDALRRDLLSEAERHAHRDALAWLAGHRDLAGWYGSDGRS